MGDVFGDLTRAVRAEAVKARHARTAAQFLVVAVVLSAWTAVPMIGYARSLLDRGRQAQAAEVLTPSSIGLGWLHLGMCVCLTVAAASVAEEYLRRTAGTTFLAVPRRWPALVAKGLVWGSVSGVITAVVLATVYGAALAVAQGPASPAITAAASGHALSVASTVPVVVLLSLLTVGLAALAPSMPLVVVGVSAWYLAAEIAVSAVPSVGAAVAPYLPLANAWHAMGLTPLNPTVDAMPWSPAASFAILAGWAVVALAAGSLRLRRDVAGG